MAKSTLNLYNEGGELVDQISFPSSNEALFSVPRTFLINPHVEKIQAGEHVFERPPKASGASLRHK